MNSTLNPSHARREASPSTKQNVQAVALCVAAALIGALFLNSGAMNWYESVQKPLWAPAFSVFVPLSMLLAIPLGLTLARLQTTDSHAPNRAWALRWMGILLALGALWSAIFFGARSPSWGYVVIFALWFAIIAAMWTGSRLTRRAFWLLLPVFGWATFASALNFAILGLNIIAPRVQKMDADPRNQRPQFLLRKPTPAPGTPVPITPELF